ncbi:DNA topoisomerase III [Endozoicomonas sp. SM1973]|uniref:DNA topoisomerase 3 n=1 Tax=Spartinivicinus marinus TaxID=2994442 RepID=A0A853HT69_9GAMM|nr:DNA topoisomerase III [Spartinivicinus marinus]MCX4029395.1 DNA topoisomerase III [Spartinivicinus marinus]NYZ64970.1 DNA topoisomerase III [Spartinivicinus marinus]
MRLFIAEKPSLGRAIADVLPKPHQKGDGYIQVGNGDYVSWCIGHLLEQAQPDVYDPAYKHWKLEHLPIIPEQWQLTPKAKTKKQLGVLRKLIKQADQLIHAGDPDREGQILVDEVINFIGVSAAKRASIQRCLISDLNPNSVRRALANLRDNRDFIPLATSALARARADWLYGINMSRVCSIQGRKAGYQGVLSVGRVQTPLLGLVVRRDQTIENFEPKPYYEVFALLKTEKGEQFRAKWQPSEACQPYQDEEGRVLSKKLAETVVKRITGQPGLITAATKKRKQQAAPLPYNLSALQIDAANRFGLNAQQVLSTCQDLYEKHKLITYPRSDCRYLPREHFNQIHTVTAAINQVCVPLRKAVAEADLSLKSKAWNDKKVEAHHAIIPTERKLDPSRLSKIELQIYELIAKQYLAQFYPAWQYDDRRIEIEISGGQFIATARQTVDLGWKKLFTKNNGKANDKLNNQNNLKEQSSEIKGDDNNHDQEAQQKLPNLKKGDVVQCIKGELAERMTQPPKPFSDATLLSAMTGIARFVKAPEIKKILRETDGLGTEATRAGIIELLFKRQFLIRQGKQIRSTETGRQLIESLPDVATTPDMTAQWESQLTSISNKETSYNSFMGALSHALPTLITQVKPESFRGLKGQGQNQIKRKYTRKKQMK